MKQNMITQSQLLCQPTRTPPGEWRKARHQLIMSDHADLALYTALTQRWTIAAMQRQTAVTVSSYCCLTLYTVYQPALSGLHHSM